MSNWSAGYVTDLGYTFGYYPELNPLRLRLAFLHAGVRFPDVGTACDLGFGQGVSTNVHAAGSMVRWYGNDFNPAQAATACQMAQVADNRAFLSDASFAEFCRDESLPDFDFIGLHGIWSWIDETNWPILVDFIRRKLKLGGVVYIGYNTLPGWASFVPLRELMFGHKEALSAPGLPMPERIDAALGFVQRVLQCDPRYAERNPHAQERFEAFARQSRHYLAHEFFNRNWNPVPFSRIHEVLAPAKIDYVCTASLIDLLDELSLSPQQRALLAEVPDAVYRETVRDFILNIQFRKDYWVKGCLRLSPLERVEQIRALRMVLTVPRSKVLLKATGAIGNFDMHANRYDPLLDFFADYQPKSFAQLEQHFQGEGNSFEELFEAVVIMAGAGHLTLAQDESTVQAAMPSARRLNRWIMEQARGSTEHNYLCCPVTGGAVVVPRIVQLMLLARERGATQHEDWVREVWACLSMQGQNLVLEGRTLSGDENIEQLRREAELLSQVHLPLLRALRVVD